MFYTFITNLKESVYMASTRNFSKSAHEADQKVALIFSAATVSTRLSKSCVDKTPFPASGQTYVRDSELKGFALRVTPGSKSFVVEKRIDGKVRRMTLGRYPALTVEQARREAHKLLGKIATGGNPIAEKATHELQLTSLQQTFDDFLQARKSLRPRTIYDYTRVMTVAFADWLPRPITAITKEKIAQRHRRLGTEHGEAYANLAMRVLRALFNFAKVQYEDSAGHSLLADNPVTRLTQTRAWYRVGRRQTLLKSHELAAWYGAVQKLKALGGSAEMVADYLLLLLFTGLRRQEAGQLRWEHVDLKGATLTIPDTKNHEPLMLPLSDFLIDLLKTRKQSAESPYVFPGGGKAGYLVEPRAQMTKVMIYSQLQFTLHDLRRTFITIAEGLDIPAYALKRLLNHKMQSDVTAGYIIADVERLRIPMQRVTDYILRAAKLKDTAEVIQISRPVSA